MRGVLSLCSMAVIDCRSTACPSSAYYQGMLRSTGLKIDVEDSAVSLARFAGLHQLTLRVFEEILN